MYSLQKLQAELTLTEAKQTEKMHQATEADRMVLERRRELESLRQQVILIKAEEIGFLTGSREVAILFLKWLNEEEVNHIVLFAKNSNEYV